MPCDDCTYDHTAAARALGATDQALQEPVTMAASVRQNHKRQVRLEVVRVFRAMVAPHEK